MNPDAHSDHEARAMLDLAARLAWRGVGLVEPNPLVGCVIVAGEGAGRSIIGRGHHARFGGPHAEAAAIADARARGHAARLPGSTMYVTLEPCAHTGKQPPCVDAVLRERIGTVVVACADPNPVAAGGAAKLMAAGVNVRFCNASAAAARLTRPFFKRVSTDLPWTIAKWAQTIDGRTATRTGESQWISNPRSRRWVHRLRGRVDAIMTGIGTARADDPLLTARGVPVRRLAARVVIDPDMDLPPAGRLASTAGGPPVIAVTCAEARARAGGKPAAPPGVIERRMPLRQGLIDLRATLAMLRREFDVHTLLVEGGAGLLGRLLADDLIDEAHVYVGPMLLGDEQAKGAAAGRPAPRLADARAFELVRVKRIDHDAMLIYRRATG